MIPNRQWILVCLAGLCWGGIAVAQNAGGASGGSSGGSGGASGGSSGASGSGSSGADSSGTPSSGTKGGTKGTEGASGTPAEGTPGDSTPAGGAPPPKTGGSADPFAPATPNTTEQPSGTGASSAFGGQPEKRETGPGFTTPGEGEAPADTASGQSSAFGPGDSTATTQPAPPSFTLPGFFGGAPTSYTGGQGRLARPRFRYKVTVSQGYDDNVLQTPDDPQRIPDQQVLVDPGTPDTVTFVPVTRIVGYVPTFVGGNPNLIHYEPVFSTTIERRVIQGRDPVIRTIRAPDPQERAGSPVSRVGLKFDMQQVTRRSLFTLDLSGSVDHYWDRPSIDGSDDYSGSLTMAYLYNLTPRLSASVTTNIAYISQPDFTRLNTPDRIGAGGAGDLVNALARANATYRWTPRLTTIFSVGENSIMFVDQSSTGATNGDSYETTFSAEARYLWKPRYTLLAEFRHVLVSYPDSSSLDSTTEVLLLGTELRLSARLSATVRLGESIRIFDESGDSSSSPYGEALLTYRIGPTSNFQWSSRFGYEEPPGVGSEVLSYRTTLNYFKSFTPRLSLATGITGVSRNITFSGQSDETEQTIDANIGLEYRYSRQLTLNANFSFTKIITTSGFRDYDRSRIFIGAEYEF